jgi:hypothetical protein
MRMREQAFQKYAYTHTAGRLTELLDEYTDVFVKQSTGHRGGGGEGERMVCIQRLVDLHCTALYIRTNFKNRIYIYNLRVQL